MTHRRHVLTLAGAIAAASPALTLAWTGYGPGGAEQPGRFPPPPAAAGSSAADAPATAPKAGTGTEPPVNGGGRQALPGGPPRLDVVGDTEANGYLLRIKVSGGRPDAVEVTPSGQSLNLSLSIGGSWHEKGSVGDGGYRQGSSAAQGSVRRRVPLPADADLRRLTREVKADTLLLHIPRVTGRRAAPGGPPGPKPDAGSDQGAR
ncbi:Hsp20/alpha crystallin family protein [uncultured Thiodictyon sp.]|jgi:HSP20 family molecular chaperone IbpA|uniref:Hsp20/alpha crystallin family protein n=1 Tax=uncultured Thiodictyon sp. TaxID=1846217 RepID=UPI0025E646EB|nr:Hsp20/alpha crystallin family protein [uncultured Thiodictyon sp.]